MPAYLVIEDNQENFSFPCDQIVTLGRDKSSDIVLNDPQASRSHAMVRCLGQENYYLIDGGSSNGTYLNAKRIVLPTLLNNGDKISLGSTHIAFLQEEKETAETIDEEVTQTIIIKPVVEVSQFVILVADIRGFTALAEALSIQSLTEVMNAWFHAVRKCIRRHEGIIDKFLGDCVYVRWETGDAMATEVARAMNAACALNDISQKLNKDYKGQLKESLQLRIGVGINVGLAALGVDQSNSAIGDAVNLAFRLENSTKEMGRDVVLGKEAYKHLPEKFWSSREQAIKVRGKSADVDVCGLSFFEVESFLKEFS